MTTQRTTRAAKEKPIRPLIDFTELEERGEPGEQFEHLMYALLKAYRLKVSPSGRGADGGRDLWVEEVVKGPITGEETRRWLVSCKNNARAGKSVPESELPHDVQATCRHYHADGFLLATTTTLSTGAQQRLDGLQANPHTDLRIRYWIRPEIEGRLLVKHKVFKLFLPKSFARWEERQQNPNTITEAQLQAIVEKRYGLSFQPNQLRLILQDLLSFGLSDPEDVRQVYYDKHIHKVLTGIYQRLLERDLDPSGHLTWGLYLAHMDDAQAVPLIEQSIRSLPEYQSRIGREKLEGFAAGVGQT